MPESIFYNLGAWLAVAILAGKAADTWMTADEIARLRARLEEARQSNAGSPSLAAPKLHLRLFETICRSTLDQRIWSKRALRRSLIIGLLAISISLAIGGLRTGSPLTLQRTPWSFFALQVQESESLAIEIAEDFIGPRTEDQRRMQGSRERMADRARQIQHFDSTMWKLLYSIWVIGSLLVAPAALFALSLAFVRYAISTLQNNESLFVYISVAGLLATIAVIGAGLMTTLLLVASIPASWFALPDISTLNLSWLAPLMIAVISGAWYFAGLTLKTALAVSVFPFALAVVLVVIAIPLHLAHSRAHSVYDRLLRNASTHTSPIAYGAAVVSVLGGGVHLLETMLFG